MATDSKDDETSATGHFNVPGPLIQLIKGIKEIYTTKEYSDLTITCKEHQWKVNKLVLCAQSEWFRKACRGEWKEGKENMISLEGDDPQVMDAVLHWFYHANYGDHGNGQEHAIPIVLDVRVFAFAEMKLLEPLKGLAAAKFTERANAEWASDGFATAVSEIYTTIPEHEDGLRSIVMHVVKERAGELFDKSGDYGHFRQVVRETPGLGDDISEVLAVGRASDAQSTSYRCPSCSTVFSIKPPDSSAFGCPRGCYSNQQASWWAGDMQGWILTSQHETVPSIFPASE